MLMSYVHTIVMLNSWRRFNRYDLLGVVVFMCGFLMEAIADI